MKRAALAILGQIAWRSFGLALIAVPIGAGAGAAIPGGSWIMGASIAFSSAFLTVASVLGVAIASTGQLTNQNIDDAFKTAVLKTLETDKEAKPDVAVKPVETAKSVAPIDTPAAPVSAPSAPTTPQDSTQN
jgi:hypothetical protein